jgi:hypothetical protein
LPINPNPAVIACVCVDVVTLFVDDDVTVDGVPRANTWSDNDNPLLVDKVTSPVLDPETLALTPIVKGYVDHPTSVAVAC